MANQQKHVLIIDDDITALDITAFLFEKKGYDVKRCADGLKAIDYVKEVKPDLILIDLLMPEINGVETVKRIRAMGITSVPIIAFTAVDDPELHEEAREAGCDDVLTKPLRPQKLLKSIEQHFKN